MGGWVAGFPAPEGITPEVLETTSPVTFESLTLTKSPLKRTHEAAQGKVETAAAALRPAGTTEN